MAKEINLEARIEAHNRAAAAMDNAVKRGQSPEQANRAYHAEITRAIYREERGLSL